MNFMKIGMLKLGRVGAVLVQYDKLMLCSVLGAVRCRLCDENKVLMIQN